MSSLGRTDRDRRGSQEPRKETGEAGASCAAGRSRRISSEVEKSARCELPARETAKRAVKAATVAGAVLGLLVTSTATTAHAYCRTTTCDVDDAQAGCTWDDDNCATAGKPLYWPDSCGWFGIQKDGSAKRKISYETMHDAVVQAFDTWSKAKCDGGVPSFAMQDTDVLYGPVECNQHEFNKKAANASAWMFRDGSWPYVGTTTTIALTTLSVDIKTGRILDADVEINSFGTNITTSDTNIGADLESIVMHESGHFLGLAHSAVMSATMFPNYPGIAIRTLDPDDEQGICKAYPPGDAPACGQPEPLYGFSKYCGGVNPSTDPEPGPEATKGCAVGMGTPSGEGAALVGLALALGLTARRRQPTARRWRTER